MNEEEIPVFRWNTETKEFYVLGHKFDGVNSIEDFLNYIHNLDKENKLLKENAEHNDKVVDKVNWENNLLKQQNQKYKEVIDKAIDYVENGDLLYLANKCSVIYRDNVEVVSICDRLNELLTKLKEVE